MMLTSIEFYPPAVKRKVFSTDHLFSCVLFEMSLVLWIKSHTFRTMLLILLDFYVSCQGKQRPNYLNIACFNNRINKWKEICTMISLG